MTGEHISPLLDEYLDGSLPPEGVARVDAHLVGCDSCRAELAALRSILADARALPRSVMPARDLWVGIEGRLGPSAAQERPAARRLGGSAARYFLLAAAAVVLMLGGAGIARLLQPTPSATSSFALEQQRYTQATAELARQLSTSSTSLPEETRAVVEHNLAIVDAAIQEAEKALDTDRGNTALEQMVLARYQQRLALLKRATDAGRQES